MDKKRFQSGFRQKRRISLQIATMRIPVKALAEKRKSKDLTILLTGATGFLGSHIAVDLLEKEYSLILLSRPFNGISASKRMAHLFEWFGIDLTKYTNIEILEGSLEKHNFGLNPVDYEFLLDNVDEIIHCAANTSFAEKKRQEVEASNISSIANVLKLATQGRCYFLHHISTAYVAGKKEGLCEEEFIETHSFYNVYEETKYKAEQTAIQICQKNGIRLNIYRPSIVYGNSETGKSIRFNALYYPVKMIRYLKNLFSKDIEHSNGKNAAKMGVKLDSDGKMLLPIRVEKDHNGTLNIIPIDFFVKACSAIMDTCLEGGIFHIVSDRPKRLEELIDNISRFFEIKGIRGVLKSEFQKTPKSAIEKLVDNFIDIYLPYMRDTRIFLNEKTRRILNEHDVVCPDFSYDVFDKCMSYAEEVNWGKKLKVDFRP